MISEANIARSKRNGRQKTSAPDHELVSQEVVQHEKLLTVREVARQLRVDDTTVRRWIKAGALPAITLPHRGARQAYRVKQSTLEALLSGQASLSSENETR